VANVDETGAPQLRTLVLREFEARLALFVNATSPKWPSLREAPLGVLVWLPTLNLQYRLSCSTSPVPDAIVHESWHLRPEPPKRLDWFYTRVRPQGSPVESRDHLLALLAGLELPDPLTAPHTARGLFLHPHVIERLDLGQDNGVHDRRRYRLIDNRWEESVLIP
jgi:pyridoxine/pyridoxamine 5'-phosphate oxidase